MARADDIFALAQAALQADKARAQSIVRVIEANEPGRSTLKVRLARLLSRAGVADPAVVPRDLAGLVMQIEPGRALDEVLLPVPVREDLLLHASAMKSRFQGNY